MRQAEADSGKRGDLLTTQEREEIRKLRRGEFRVAARERDLEVGERVFCQGARPGPAEASAFVDAERARFGVEPICQALDVSASAYYQRASGDRSPRQVEDERLLERIRELHAANYYAYGYRRMWKALGRAGEQVPRCRVQRLMKTNGIVGAKRRGKPWRTTRADPLTQRRPDLVQRDFSASGPNKLWVADLSYLRCWEGLVYFAFVIDTYSRMIVGWQLASHMRTDLVGDALKMALGLRESGADIELVHHSDRGSLPEFKESSQHRWLTGWMVVPPSGVVSFGDGGGSASVIAEAA